MFLQIVESPLKSEYLFIHTPINMNSKLSLPFHYQRKMPACARVNKRSNRIDYLALDNDLVKIRHSYVPRARFALSRTGAWEIMPLDQKFPFAFASAKQVLYSCHKIGCRLFTPDNVDFDLNDPFLYRTRFTIEYNSLYDPALESYFRRQPVRKKLLKAKQLNDRDDAVCSKRYFFEYVRFLENRRMQKIKKQWMQKVSELI